MPSFELRWGIASTGWIATHFARETLIDPATRSVADVSHRVTAVSSRSEDRAEFFIDEHLGTVNPRPHAYTSLEELCADENVDAVYIATPNTNHYQNATTCLKLGKHVLLEKPSTMNARQTQRLFELAKEKERFLMEAHWTHFLPVADKVREIIDSGVLGDIKHVDSKYLLDIRAEDLPPDDRYISAATGDQCLFEDLDDVSNGMFVTGGGSLLDLGPYAWVWIYLTAYRASFGASHTSDWPIPHIGGASITKMCFDLDDRPSGEVDESSAAVMTFPSPGLNRPGITAFFHTCLAVLPGHGAPCCTVMGTKGKLTVNFPASKPERITLETHDTHRPSLAPSHRKINVQHQHFDFLMPGECRGFVFEMDEVARCVRNGKLESSVMPAGASIVAMKIFDEIRRQTSLVFPSDSQSL